MTPKQHETALAEFIRGVDLAGGTTPHVAMVDEAMKRETDPLQKLWWAGAYALCYNFAAAEIIVNEIDPYSFTESGFLRWSTHHWQGIPKRKERKAVFVKENFARSMATYLEFTDQIVQNIKDDDWWQLPTWDAAYDAFTKNCKFMGRYIAIRWLELMRRHFNTNWIMPSICSDGGQHPRKALALIYPGDAEALLGGNTQAEVALADRRAEDLLISFRHQYRLHSDYYQLQSLLCEYKQSVLGKKQYPGKSIDTEVDYFDKTKAYWGEYDTIFWDVRQAVFPRWSLGEIQGWYGARKELGSVLVDHGYTWSDNVYDYVKTRDSGDFSNPIHRAGGRKSIL